MGETKRLTVSLPMNAYEQLTDELDTFSSDTARFQHLVQLYLTGGLVGSPAHPSKAENASPVGNHGTSTRRDRDDAGHHPDRCE